MARFLITASGCNADRVAAIRPKLKGTGIRITGNKADMVFRGTRLLTVSCPTKAGANKVRDLLWDEGCGCVEIEKLPDRGYGGRRMGAEIPVNSYMD